MKTIKFSNLIFYILFTSLIISDYFPNFILAKVIPREWNAWLIIGWIVWALIFRRSDNTDTKEELAEQVFSLLYFLGLLVVLTFLGGSSASGLGLRNIGVWGAAVFAIWEIFTSIRKIKADTV